MQLVENSDYKKEFVVGNSTYIMISTDNGEDWSLYFMDKKTDEGMIHVGTSATSNESYLDITIYYQDNNISRRIVIDNGFVISDYIIVLHGIENGRINETKYYALDVDTSSTEKVPFLSYIMSPLPIDLKGYTLEGKIPDISILLEFFNANNNLRNLIASETGIIL